MSRRLVDISSFDELSPKQLSSLEKHILLEKKTSYRKGVNEERAFSKTIKRLTMFMLASIVFIISSGVTIHELKRPWPEKPEYLMPQDLAKSKSSNWYLDHYSIDGYPIYFKIIKPNIICLEEGIGAGSKRNLGCFAASENEIEYYMKNGL